MDWGLFVPSEDIGFFPQLFLMACYGFILYKASCLISDGSEMLLSLYGPGIIGGLLIPILGALPDSAIILVSGLGGGSKDEVQQQLRVGVGTLAGSTIMLLTIPWGASVFLGRRDLDEQTGEAAVTITRSGRKKPRLTHFSWTTNVVSTSTSVPVFARMMMVTALSYLIIQIPAFFYDKSPDASSREKNFALVGFIVTLVAFFAYSIYQLVDANQEEYVKQRQQNAERQRWQASLKDHFHSAESFARVFEEFDHDKNGHLDRKELHEALSCLGLQTDRKQVQQIIDEMDTDKDNLVSPGEFQAVIFKWIANHSAEKIDSIRKSQPSSPTLRAVAAHTPSTNIQDDDNRDTAIVVNSGDSNNHANNKRDRDDFKLGGNDLDEPFLGGNAQAGHHGDDDDDDDDEEEAEEEYWELTDSQLIRQAVGLLLLGTALVSVFSDPMVDVITNFGDTISVSPFYISFVVTPLASNASEVISALIFAKKKTNRGMSLTLSSLYGAATMNNTLCLSIFMGLVYFRELKWAFSAEVISILVVTYAVGLNGLKTTIKLWQAVLVAAMFPISLVIVIVLENGFGLD